MTDDQPNDNSPADQFTRGLDLLKAGDYWEAHEAWEDLWHTLPKDCAARRATKALIQLAAICYKPEQAASGRCETAMQRGMGKLIETAQTHLRDSGDLPGPTPGFDDHALADALARLEAIHNDWCHGEELHEIRCRVQQAALCFTTAEH